MKCFRQVSLFMLCQSLLLGSLSVYAEEEIVSSRPRENAKTTPHSYNPGGFCNSGAENMMTKLQEDNKGKFDQINEYKKQINDLANYSNILTDVSAIKDRYLESLDKMAGTKQDNTITESLDNAKSVIRHGLILSAIEKNIDAFPAGQAANATPYRSLCANGSIKGICSPNYKPKSSAFALDIKFKSTPAKEADKLDKTLADFQKVSKSLPQKQEESLNQEVKKIISDIPKDIAPEAILDSLDSESPIMAKVLSGDISREDLLLCIGEEKSQSSNEACKKILSNPEDRALLVKSLSSEKDKVSTKFKDYSNVIKIARDNNKNDFEKLLENYDSGNYTLASAEQKQLINVNMQQLMRSSLKIDDMNIDIKNNLRYSQMTIDKLNNKSIEEKTKEKMLLKETDLLGMENFFYSKPTNETLKLMGFDLNTKEGAVKAQDYQQRAIDNAKKDAKLFTDECDFSAKSNVDNDQMMVCKGLFQKLIPKIKTLQNAHIEQMNDLNVKIQKLASDSDFAAAENLKEYVAEKYLCSCEKNKKGVKTTYEESLRMSTNSCSTQFMTLGKIEGLSDSTSAIAQALYAHEIKMPMDSQGCTFAPEELKAFTDTCNNSDAVRSKYTDICSSINNEYVAKVKVQQDVEKQNAKWEKYNDENYVEYNRKSPTGYSAVKKKSTMRVIGEGVLPILPNALPIWFGNYQMKNNINTLTDQALLQKQYLHNIDIYNSSPWMYNYNYFSYGNPFATNTSLSTTTSSTGFNFGL